MSCFFVLYSSFILLLQLRSSRHLESLPGEIRKDFFQMLLTANLNGNGNLPPVILLNELEWIKGVLWTYCCIVTAAA